MTSVTSMTSRAQNATPPRSRLRESLQLSALVTMVVLLWSGSAQALYLDFADFQGSESGNRADINFDGTSISISSQPSRFDLTISNSGLGVGCTDGFWRCLSNSDSQIDAEWNEQITITFNDGPVAVESVILSQLYRGEVAVVGTEALRTTVEGTGWRRRSSTAVVDMGNVMASEITFSARGWFSDMSVRGIVFNRSASVGSVPGPTHPVPEPHAALLFIAGLGVVAARRGRS